MSETAQAPCEQCGMPRLPHQLARERGEIGHDWRGSTVEKPKDVEHNAPSRVFITVVPTPDLALRRMLVELGVITESDLVALRARDVTPQLPSDIL